MPNERSPYADPSVITALKERGASAVAVILCPLCGHWSYYNEGGHYECRACVYSAAGQRLDSLLDMGQWCYLSDYDPEDMQEEENIP